MTGQQESILIIGGGVSGLMAAKRLVRHFQVTVLEADGRIGGRILTISDRFTCPVDGGAEFVHGKLPQTLRLLKKAGIEHELFEPSMYRVASGQWEAQGEMIPGWKKLLKAMKKEEEEMPLSQFLNLQFGGPEHAEFREQVKGYAEGFDLADPDQASMKALYREWSATEDELYRIPGGYGQLVNYLEQQCVLRGCDIFMNTVVKQIDWAPGEVVVYTEDGRKFTAQKCLITVPVRLLGDTGEQASIKITPTPEAFVPSLLQVGYGTAIKLAIEFKEAFWTSVVPEPGFILSEEEIPTWWTQSPVTVPILIGWVGGPPAERLAHCSDDEIVATGLRSLAAMFKRDVAELNSELKVSTVFNWKRRPFSRGAYSYSLPGTEDARKHLNEPVADTIFFVGEGVYAGKAGGTVEAALVSGKEVAALIRKKSWKG